MKTVLSAFAVLAAATCALAQTSLSAVLWGQRLARAWPDRWSRASPPPGYVSMLTDYIGSAERFVTCPNQDTIYGAGFQSRGSFRWNYAEVLRARDVRIERISTHCRVHAPSKTRVHASVKDKRRTTRNSDLRRSHLGLTAPGSQDGGQETVGADSTTRGPSRLVDPNVRVLSANRPRARGAGAKKATPAQSPRQTPLSSQAQN